MKIAIIGRTHWLYETACYLRGKGFIIPLVITGPAAPEYSKKEKDFEKFAIENKADFYLGNSLDTPGLISKMSQCDVGISVNWMSIIKQKHIECFRLGILNAHMGDIPRYRGNACPNWAIISGEKEIVVSIHIMEGGKLDCGRVITQQRMPLTKDTYIEDIYRWGEKVIPLSFLKALSLLEKDSHYSLKYADASSSDSLRCYPRRPEDGQIDWRYSAEQIHRLIRASSKPFSGAYCFLNGKKMIIWQAEMDYDNERYCAVPGQICEVASDYFVVITGKGKLKITKWECSEKMGK